MILGSDHSHWDWQNEDNGYCPIDWARSKAIFVFLKSFDGPNTTPYYLDEIIAARTAGKLAAPYVWCHGRNWYDPRKQAKAWYSRLKDEPLIAIDFEEYSTSLPDYDDLYNAIERLRELGYAGKLIIYTGHWYWLAHGNTADYWKQFPVWLARYSSTPPQSTPPFGKEIIWQFSANGNPANYGITNGKLAVDENWFYGTQAELEELFGGGVVPPIDPPPPEGEPMNAHNPNPLSLRTAPRVAPETFILTMPANTQIVGTEIVTATDGSKWLKTTSPQAGYCASWLLVYDTVPPVDGLPVIHIHQLYSASGYPDLVIDKDWTPNA